MSRENRYTWNAEDYSKHSTAQQYWAKELISKLKLDGFEFPYGFHDPEDYGLWLKEANLNPIRVELIPKGMSYKDKDGLAGWIRTTWLPYTDRVPVHRRNEFITHLVEKYIEKHPLDSTGNVHVRMVRLEVEAIN